METLPADISLIPTYMYSVVSGAIKDLLKECSLDCIDEKLIYASLEQRLVEMGSRQD